MTRIRTAIVLFACSLQVCLAEEKKAPSRSAATVHWPQFRGPDASGVAEGSAPTKWDAAQRREAPPNPRDHSARKKRELLPPSPTRRVT